MTELRSQADVTSWLAAGMLLRRVEGDADDAFLAQTIAACANELAAMPPAAVIVDIALLLGGGRQVTGAPPTGDETLRTAIRAYDDDVLARLVQTARFDDVLAAYAHAAPADRPQAIALVVGAISVAQRLRGRAGVAGRVAPPRRSPALREERDAAGRAALEPHTASTSGSWSLELLEADEDAPALSQKLADAYQRLARGARQCRALVDDREVFTVDHLAVLRDLGGRMTADHVHSAAEALGRTLPRRLPPHRAQRGVRDTQFADDSLYPAGGFTAITPGGSNASIENLVTSELVYMEDGPGPDVFTLRYVEGELLYYTRDDSVFRRHRHVIGIALCADLDDARVKDRGLPWQRLVLALGMLVATIRWLTEQLGDQALAIHLAFPPTLLGEERQILSLLLEGEISRGTVIIEEQKVADLLEVATKASSSAISDVVVVSLGPTPDLPKGLRAMHLNLAGAAPSLTELAPRRATPAELGPDSWAEWCDGAEDLLRWLV